jgi:hypothetical protein
MPRNCLHRGAIVKASTHIYLPIAHSVPKCTSCAGANDDRLKDFLIDLPKNTNFASEKSDRLLTVRFSLLGKSYTPGTSQLSTLKNLHNLSLKSEGEFKPTTFVNIDRKCQKSFID